MPDMNKRGLPAYAYAMSRYTQRVVRVVRGENTLFMMRWTAHLTRKDENLEKYCNEGSKSAV